MVSTLHQWKIFGKDLFKRHKFVMCDVLTVEVQPKSYLVNQTYDSRGEVSCKHIACDKVEPCKSFLKSFAYAYNTFKKVAPDLLFQCNTFSPDFLFFAFSELLFHIIRQLRKLQYTSDVCDTQYCSACGRHYTSPTRRVRESCHTFYFLPYKPKMSSHHIVGCAGLNSYVTWTRDHARDSCYRSIMVGK